MMDDLISRSALIEKLHKRAHDWRGSFAGDAYRNAVQMIKKEPAVDAVVVVRCKDCKHRIDNKEFVRGHYCKKRPSNGGYFCEDNDFCSYGERKEE